MDALKYRYLAVAALCSITAPWALAATAFPGNPPITPRWTYEPWVWEDDTHTTASSEGLVNNYLSRNIPVGVIILDSPWSTSYTDFTFNAAAGKQYADATGPAPATMINWFATSTGTNTQANGVRVVCWMVGMVDKTTSQDDGGQDPPLTQDPSYASVLKSGSNLALSDPNSSPAGNQLFTYWKGTAAAIDYTNPTAVNWFMGQATQLLQMGVSGFKVDVSDGYLPNPVQTTPGSVFAGANITQSQFTEYYYAKIIDWLATQTIIWKGSNRANEGITLARPASFQEPGGTGAPVSRLTAGWCGDFAGDFNGFTTQLSNIYTSVADNYSALGFEVGGYNGNHPSHDSLLREAEYAALMPVMENGGASARYHEPWLWDSSSPPSGSTVYTDTVSTYQYYATLHHNLVPFQFHCGVNAHLTGTTAMTQIDTATHRHVLGNSLLTFAVTSSGTPVITMDFPAGDHWINWWNLAQVFNGGTQTTGTYNVDTAPIFVRAGSIIPMQVNNSVTGLGDTNSAGSDTVLIFPYQVPYQTDQLVYHRPLGDGITYEDVTLSAAEGANGFVQVNSPTSRSWIFKIAAFAAPTNVTGADSWSYNGTTHLLTVSKTGSAFAISISPLAGYSTLAPPTTGTDVWTGVGSDANWETLNNWSGANNPPVPGDALVFGGTTQLNNTSDFLALTSFTGIIFSTGAGAFVLSGNALTVTGNILNSAAGVNETIGMNIISDGGAARTITSATNAILTFAGSFTRTTTAASRGLDLVGGATGGGTYQFSGLVNLNNPVLLTTDATHSGVSQRNNTTVNLLSGASLNINGGYWAIGQNSATLTDPAAVLNVNNGASMTVSGSSDFEVGYNFNAAANANSNHGILNINNGGVFTAVFGSLADASGYIRLGLNGSTTATSITQGTVNLLSGGSLVTSRTFVTGGSLANTGVNHTAEQGNFLFDGGTLTTDGTNNANWFQSVTSGAGSQFLPMTSVAINAGGAILDTAGVNATISHAMIPGTTAGGGLTKQGAGTLTLSGNNSYTGSTTVLGGILEITGTVAGTSSLTVINSGVFYLAGGSLSVSGAITNNGIFKLSGTPTLTQTGSFINNGVLDLINGPQSLPSNFTNNGAILNSSSVQVQQLARNGSNFTLTIYGDPQHTFQLQRSTSLVAPVTWTNVGAPQVGTGFPLVFTDTSATGVSGFYQVLVLP